jgi:hypothetical protein
MVRVIAGSFETGRPPFSASVAQFAMDRSANQEQFLGETGDRAGCHQKTEMVCNGERSSSDAPC